MSDDRVADSRHKVENARISSVNLIRQQIQIKGFDDDVHESTIMQN